MGQPAHGCQCVACGLRRVCCLQLAATLQAQLQQLQQAMLSDSAAEAALQQQLSASQAMGSQAQRELQAAHQQVQELREGQGQLQGTFGTCSVEHAVVKATACARTELTSLTLCFTGNKQWGHLYIICRASTWSIACVCW